MSLFSARSEIVRFVCGLQEVEVVGMVWKFEDIDEGEPEDIAVECETFLSVFHTKSCFLPSKLHCDK